jgi:hypothetical protein
MKDDLGREIDSKYIPWYNSPGNVLFNKDNVLLLTQYRCEECYKKTMSLLDICLRTTQNNDKSVLVCKKNKDFFKFELTGNTTWVNLPEKKPTYAEIYGVE